MTRSGRVFRVVSQSILALTIGSTIAYAQVRQPPHTQVPMSYKNWLQLRSDPARMSRLLLRPAPVISHAPAGVVIGPWQTLNNLPTGNLNAANPLLLTDGSVIVHIDSTRFWWKLTPDINGSYVNGTWTQIASLPPGYEPRFFASQILSDGRVIINGGEYNSGAEVWTNMGAIYDPVLDVWKPVNPPLGWQSIGDAQSVVLDDGTYLLANALTKEQALLTGFDSMFTWTATGSGKADINDEEGWSLLPDGNVLTVNAYVLAGTCDTGSELYDDERGTWTSAGSTIVQLPDCSGNQSFELGPQLLRPDGTAIAFGGTTTGTAHTAIFDSSTYTWTVGPDVPSVGGIPYTLADAPSALLPSGNVLFAASPSNWPAATGPGAFPPPTHFFEVDHLTNNITQVTDNPDGANLNSFQWNFLVLPTGQILATETDTPNIWIYTPSGSPDPTWKPIIYASPEIVSIGSDATYRLTGIQFNGLSEGVSYGDDVQASTNFPIVAIVNDATGHVFYQRTFGFTRSVASGGEAGTSVDFTVTAKEMGASSLYVIANGIASDPVPVVVQ